VQTTRLFCYNSLLKCDQRQVHRDELNRIIMESTFHKWLEELSDELEVIQSDDLNEEANGNLITFNVPNEPNSPLNEQALIDFITGCRDYYQQKMNSTKMVFYSWYDEQSDQLRISAVSQKHAQLPFRCKIKNCQLIDFATGIIDKNSGLFSEQEQLNVWQSDI